MRVAHVGREDAPARVTVAERLQERRVEIEQAALARVHSISGDSEAADSEYAEGLRAAVSAALDYGLAAIERGEERVPPLPAALLTQARLAARNGVSLDTVLRRYFAGYTLLSDFLIEEAERMDLLLGAALQRVLRGQANLFDRLVAAVTEAYKQEERVRVESTERRRAERVERLLAGELLDTVELAYDVDLHHVGVVAAGPGAEETLRALSASLDRRLLSIGRGEGTLWAWLGGRSATDSTAIVDHVAKRWPERAALAIGEPAQGLSGWRLSHRQASAAFPIALRGAERCVRYADVALLAATLDDELLSTSLHQLYLAPLARERDGGETLRKTLRAYLRAERNVSSAAAALGVSRQTVVNRLRAVEERIGRPLGGCVAEVDAALRLEDLGHSVAPRAAFSAG